jgi:hypothetical protein
MLTSTRLPTIAPDRSFQTDVPAEPARPERGTASGAAADIVAR